MNLQQLKEALAPVKTEIKIFQQTVIMNKLQDRLDFEMYKQIPNEDNIEVLNDIMERVQCIINKLHAKYRWENEK